jgi:hypothetical protein
METEAGKSGRETQISGERGEILVRERLVWQREEEISGLAKEGEQ